jgi:hypothetical protein
MSNEVLADRLGQIIFRLECNAGYVTGAARHASPTSKHYSIESASKDIQADLEKLKEIKAELLRLDGSP